MNEKGKRNKQKGLFYLFLFFLFFAILTTYWSGGISPLQAKETDARTHGKLKRIEATTCKGWANAAAARKASEKPQAAFRDFREEQAAVFRFVPATTEGFGTTPVNDELECFQFVPPDIGSRWEIAEAYVVLSLGALAGEQAMTALHVTASSDDGQTWQTVSNLPIYGEVSNAQHDGYFRFALFGVTSPDRLQRLRLKLTATTDESYSPVTILADALGLELRLRKTSDKAKQSFFSLSEEPTIVLDTASLKGYELLDQDGNVVDAEAVIELVDGKTKISFRKGAALRPGTYIVRTKSKRFFRTVIEEKAFSFGLATVNTPAATYKPGDLVSFSIGVLDDRGATICDADITLRITKPSGDTLSLSTSDGSVVGSAECGPKSITNQPDYSASIIAEEAGTYRTSLEILTNTGTNRVDGVLLVESQKTFHIERLAPTRINPKAQYRVRLRVTPTESFSGQFQEVVPSDFTLTDLQPTGITQRSGGQHVITWNADFRAGETQEFSYVFDAPDISPALFTLGPARLGTLHEPRLWGMSSDEAVKKEKANLSYESVPVTEEDFQKEHERLASATKSAFSDDENAHIKVFKNGFSVPSENVPSGLDAVALVVKNVEVLGPWKEAERLGAYHVSEELQRGEQNIEMLHLVQNDDFHPGVYTVRTTLTDGVKEAVEETTFVWGVLVVNPEKSIYLRGETAKFGMAVLDATGKTLCEADLKLTVTTPSGTTTVFDTTDGTITRSYDCDVHSVTNTPDYAAEYTLPQKAGTYKLTLESTITEGQERTGSNQSYRIEDSFEVRASVPFDISRFDTPTRLYPVADYTAHITIKANEDWNGSVSEFMPASFRVYNISNGGETSTSADGLKREIRWQVNWHAGETYTLLYSFDPPNPSPRVYPLGPFVINQFQETRAWQLAADATRVWDGGHASSANWSQATNWDTDTVVATGDTVVFDGSAGGTPNDNSTVDSSAPASITSLTISSYSGTLTLTLTPFTVTGAFSHTSTGAITSAASAAYSIGGDLTITTSGTFTASTATWTMTSTSANLNSNKTFSGITIDPSSAGIITVVTNSPSVSALLTVASGDQLTISSGLTVTLTANSGTSLTLNGTINGPGRLTYQNSGTVFPTGGTLANTLITRFDTKGGNMTVPARTDYGAIEAFGGGVNARTVTLGTAGSQTITTSSYFYVIANAAATYDVTLQGATWDPTLNVGGDFDFTGTGAANEIVTAPNAAATWTVSGNVDLTGGTYTTSAETLKMNGSSKTLTTASNNLYNFEVSGGTVSNADATTVTGTFAVSGGQFTADAYNFSVTGTSSITGTLVISSATGTKTFTGAVTINSGGVWNNSGNEDVAIKAGLAHSGTTFTSGSGTYTFSTSSQAIAGSSALTFSGAFAISGAITVTNNNSNTVTITGNLTGDNASSNFTIGTNTSTKLGGTVMSTGVLTPSTSASTIEYNGATQTVKAPTTNPYYHLALSGSGTVTLPSSGMSSITGNLTLSGTVAVTSQATLTVGGDVSVAAGITYTVNHDLAVNGGDFTTTGSGIIATSAGTPTVTVDGGGSIGGGSGAITFYNFTKTGSGTTTFSGSGTNTVNNTLSVGTGNGIFVLSNTMTVTGDATVATGATFRVNADLTVNGGDFTNTGTGVITYTSGTPTVTVAGTGSIGGVSGSTTFYNLTLSGTPTLAANIQVDTNLTLPSSVTAGSTTVTMAGTGNLVGGGATLNNLTINGSGNTVTLTTSDLTVSGTITIGGAADGNNDTLSIASGRTLTSPVAATVTFVASGTDTISGSGTLTVKHNNLDTDGTLSSVVRFDATDVPSLSIPQRTFGGAVEVYSNNSTTNRTVTLGTDVSQTITFSGDLTIIAANNNNITLGGATYDPTVNVTGNIDFTGAGAGNELLSAGSGTWTVSGNADFSGGTYTTAVSNVFKMDGTAGKTLTIGANTNFTNLTIDPSSAATVNVETTGTTLTVTAGLTVASGDTLDITSGSTVKWTGSSMTITGGTVSGAGRLTIDSATTIPTDGTLSAITRFDVSNGATAVIPQRTFNGQVEVYSNSSTARSITLGTGASQTITTAGASSHLYVIADGASPGDVTVTAATNDPAVTIGGDLDFTGSGSSTEVIVTGAGTWSVAGNANLTDGTWTTEGTNKLKMTGTGTLTTDNETLLDLEINSSGTVTLAAATHTMTGSLTLAGSGTPTVTGSTIAMTGAGKTIDGGGKTLANLTISNTSGTISLQNTDLTVSSLLTVSGGGGSLTVNSGRTLTLSGNSGTTLTLTGTLNGPGRLTYQNSATTFPTGGTLATTPIVRFDTLNGNMVVPARTDYGALEAFGDSANARTVTLGTAGSQTITLSSYLYVTANASSPNDITLQGATWDPTLNVAGAFDFTGTGSASEVVTAPDAAATWTISGNLDLTGGTWTPSAETVLLNGSSAQTVTSDSETIRNLTITNTSGSFSGCGSPMTAAGIDFADAVTVSNNFTITTQNVKVEFEPGVTHTFQNINWNGVATDGVVFRSESASAWNLDINGTQTAVSYVSVAYSDATLTSGGVGSFDGTNTDCSNNTNWNIAPTFSFSISDTAIGFGTLDSGNARWATGDTNGSASDTAAHTLQILTNATSGYAITYNGATLTSGSATIDVASITNDADGTQGSEQFGIGVSTDGASAAATGYDHNATAAQRDWTFVAGSPQTLISKSSAVSSTETISVFYLGNIAATTESGAYSTDISYIATGTF